MPQPRERNTCEPPQQFAVAITADAQPFPEAQILRLEALIRDAQLFADRDPEVTVFIVSGELQKIMKDIYGDAP